MDSLTNSEQDSESVQDDLAGNLSEDELEEMLGSRETTITVVGCGGGGSNTVTRMTQAGIEGANVVAANTDIQHLAQETQADEKILLGKKLTNGKGAGSVPEVGRKAALETEADIRDAVDGSDMVFITAGLGGGTGTGAAPVVAEYANEAGALTIAVVTLPFTAEGERRQHNAEGGLHQLREEADTVIVVPNDRLLKHFGDMPVNQAFAKADEVLMRSVKGITELITQSGLVNLDFADVKNVMEDGDVALIGLGSSSSEQNRAERSVKDAIESPMLDVDIDSASSVLVNVTGGNDMSIEEAEGVVEYLHGQVDDARIIWGTSVDEDLGDEMSTMLIVTGVESPQIYGDEPETPNADDIDYVE